MQKITPFFWFNDNAEKAAAFYTSVFDNSKIVTTTYYGDAGPRPKGSVMTVEFQLRGQHFVGLNGGPMATFTPAISLFVHCDAQEIDTLYEKLSSGGEILMPLDEYPFSDRYAFLKDQFGVAWQLMLSSKRHIAPCLLFVGNELGKAEAAVKFYTSVFKHASIAHMFHYKEGEGSKVGTVKHAAFLLEGQEFMAMDGTGPHAFSFSGAISFVVNCATQEEVDYFWERLAKGGETQRCGWLKDRFGISWQVVPTVLPQLLQHKDPAKAQAVMSAMMKMDKIEIAALQHAAQK